MLRALYAGVSGMRNQQTRIDVIGNNIANVNTTGFKAGRVNFADQMSQLAGAASAPGTNRGGTNPKQVGLGVTTAMIDTIMTQGNLQPTGKVTDLAIQGDGFFILGDGPNRYYTRAGAFDFDRDGNLVNPGNGMAVMGWARVPQYDTATPPQLTGYTIDQTAPVQPLKVPAGAVIPPKATTTMDIRGNLDERIPVGGTYNMTTEVFDELGNQHSLTVTFTHDSAGQWSWVVQQPAAPTDLTVVMNPASGGVVKFDGNGLLDPSNTAASMGTVQLTWDPDPGNRQQTSTTISPNFGTLGSAAGLTQFALASTAVVADQNGYTRGDLVGITIDKAGVVDGVFSNGRQQVIGQVAIATFANAGGLMKSGDNTYVKTSNSGDAIVREPGAASSGTLASGTLEMSNVDLAQQFSDMIVTQRGFQASSRIITTSDEILQELINLKR